MTNVAIRLSAAEEAWVCTQYQTGSWSLRQLAERCDVTHECIRNVLRRRRISLNPPHHRLARRAS